MSYEQAIPTSSVTPTEVTAAAAVPITLPIAAAAGGNGGHTHLHNHNTMVAPQAALEGAGPITAISTAIAGGQPTVADVVKEVKKDEKLVTEVAHTENLILKELKSIRTDIDAIKNVNTAKADSKAVAHMEPVFNCNLGNAMHENKFPHDKSALSQTPPGMKVPTP